MKSAPLWTASVSVLLTKRSFFHSYRSRDITLNLARRWRRRRNSYGPRPRSPDNTAVRVIWRSKGQFFRCLVHRVNRITVVSICVRLPWETEHCEHARTNAWSFGNWQNDIPCNYKRYARWYSWQPKRHFKENVQVSLHNPNGSYR